MHRYEAETCLEVPTPFSSAPFAVRTESLPHFFSVSWHICRLLFLQMSVSRRERQMRPFSSQVTGFPMSGDFPLLGESEHLSLSSSTSLLRKLSLLEMCRMHLKQHMWNTLRPLSCQVQSSRIHSRTRRCSSNRP